MIRALRKMQPSVRVVAMSGLISDGQTAELAELNIETVLSKPFTAENLLSTVAKLLRP